MTPIRLLGLGVAAIGLMFAIVGVNSTHAPLDQLSHALTGQYSHETMLYLTGGIAAIIAGAVLMAIQSR